MNLRMLIDENGEIVHACATASFPLPTDHWIYQTPSEPSDTKLPNELRSKVREAMKYTIQVCTSNGKDNDFDPDAMLLCMENLLFHHMPLINSEL